MTKLTRRKIPGIERKLFLWEHAIVAIVMLLAGLGLWFEASPETRHTAFGLFLLFCPYTIACALIALAVIFFVPRSES